MGKRKIDKKGRLIMQDKGRKVPCLPDRNAFPDARHRGDKDVTSGNSSRGVGEGEDGGSQRENRT